MAMEVGRFMAWAPKSELIPFTPRFTPPTSISSTSTSSRGGRRRRVGHWGLKINAVAAATPTARSGGRRLTSPRAGRELALSMIYASCLQGSSDPLTLFNNRINNPDPTEADEVLLGSCVWQYDETRLGGPPVTVETAEEEEELERREREESGIEAAVLGGPPRAVYARHTLELTRSLLMAVTRRWDRNVAHINALVPPPWNHEAGGRILELCILHLAMSEIAVLRTRHQIVINEAVDLAKRFCDGAAPRTINGCLRSFVTLQQQQQHKTAA